MTIQTIEDVTKLHWAGQGHPSNQFMVHGLDGVESGQVQSILAGVGIHAVAQEERRGMDSYIVSVDGAAAERLQRLMIDARRIN